MTETDYTRATACGKVAHKRSGKRGSLLTGHILPAIENGRPKAARGGSANFSGNG